MSLLNKFINKGSQLTSGISKLKNKKSSDQIQNVSQDEFGTGSNSIHGIELPKNVSKKNVKIVTKKTPQDLTPKSYYSDLINPYQILFHPSYMEVNGEKMIDSVALNEMSGEKDMNYLQPILKYPTKNIFSLFFSPIDTTKLLERYKKELVKFENKYNKDIDEGREVDKKLKSYIEDYTKIVTDLEEGYSKLVSYGMLYSHEIDRKEDGEDLNTFQDARKQLRQLFSKRVQQPSKYYTPVGQMEEAYLSQFPLMEYRLKDWSNISTLDGIILYPFFTLSKVPSVKDGVPYGINRATGELMFFNHSGLYDNKEITNRNLNVFGGTGSGKSSFFRSQMPLRMSYGDHFIIVDPKRDYVAFTKDMGGQNISFTVDEPMGLNLFYRSTDTYERKKADGKVEIKAVQSVESKKQNLLKIFGIMCPFLGDKSAVASFAQSILDSALSRVYEDSPDGEGVSLQIFYDKYLKQTITYYVKNEPEKLTGYTEAGERLKTELGAFVVREDGYSGKYYKMFEPVPKEKELVLQDGPLINFDLSSIFRDDQLFTIGALIAFEFTWTQISTRKWQGRTCYIVVDENWKLLKYETAGEYEEAFSRLIRGLGGGIYTFTQSLKEYINSESGQQLLNQAQTSVVLKLEDSEFVRLKDYFPTWFTDEVVKDFQSINQKKNSHGQGYLFVKGRHYPIKYLYLPSSQQGDSFQERKAWQVNADSEAGYEQK